MTVFAKDVTRLAVGRGFTCVKDKRDWWDNPLVQTWERAGEKVTVQYGCAPRHANGTVLEAERYSGQSSSQADVLWRADRSESTALATLFEPQ